MTASTSTTKTGAGNFFETFRVGQVIAHATPRTITEGDVAVYQGLYGSRFAVQSSVPFARAIGYPTAPVDDLIVFHVILGKTVPDISLNAIANLGYADCRFLAPVFPGDTLTATSEVLGLRENSSGDSGIVYVRTNGINQDGATVLTYARWVMVRKRDKSAPAPTPSVPKLPEAVMADQLGAAVPSLHVASWDKALAGSAHFWDDYAVGEKIDHVDGMTIEEAEHQIATRLYQNTARVHFNQHVEGQGRFGRRLVYGGVVISLARALSFNGLANAFHIAAINGGRHVAPAFAGDTVYAWTGIIDKAEVPGRKDVGALRLRMVATKDLPCASFPLETAPGKYAPGVILDLDFWALLPRA
ncbi:MAG TPA: MaoC family dehydratase [Hyphomicrobiaceae bacterium]|nr:MaoC family dehydratase [Hyphomicrobiaceae bacterium]